MRTASVVLFFALVLAISGCGGNVGVRGGTWTHPNVQKIIPNYQSSAITIRWAPTDGFLRINGGNCRSNCSNSPVCLLFSTDCVNYTSKLDSGDSVWGQMVVFVKDQNGNPIREGNTYFFSLAVSDSDGIDYVTEPWILEPGGESHRE